MLVMTFSIAIAAAAFALIFPVTFTLRPFLAKKEHSAEDVEKMYAAWVKSCLLQVTLWSHPYVKDGDF